MLLNPISDGWARYHAFGASSQAFNSTNDAIFRSLWGWIRRRHPRKNARWCKGKYFPAHKQDQWRFSGEVSDEKGQPYRVFLHGATDTHIRRHVPIRKDANPFDPAWEPYFEKRLDVNMERSLTGRRRLAALWVEQRGLCGHCGQKITKLTGWHSHHVIWRSQGGRDTPDNRVLLHPTCHDQIHHQGLSVVKPPRVDAVRKA